VDYRGVAKGDAATAARFNALLRQQGILKPESKMYMSLALEDRDLEHTVEAIAYTAAHLNDAG